MVKKIRGMSVDGEVLTTKEIRERKKKLQPSVPPKMPIIKEPLTSVEKKDRKSTLIRESWEIGKRIKESNPTKDEKKVCKRKKPRAAVDRWANDVFGIPRVRPYLLKKTMKDVGVPVLDLIVSKRK